MYAETETGYLIYLSLSLGTHTTASVYRQTREAEANRRGALVWAHLRAHPTTIRLPRPAPACTLTLHPTGIAGSWEVQPQAQKRRAGGHLKW